MGWQMLVVLLPLLLLTGWRGPAMNEVMAAELPVGMSAVMSGSAAVLGQQMALGVRGWLEQVNAAGGVHGNTLRLIVRDDGYEPEQAARNMRHLIEQDRVLAVIGNVGTPTAVVTVPIANALRTLLFGSYTGADLLRRQPPDRYVVNLRASYAEETAEMVRGLLSRGIRPEELAFFTQNDGYGDAGYRGAVQALQQAGYAAADALPHGRYTRNTLHVEEGLGVILDAAVEPRVIIMVGAYQPCARFIQLARAELPRARFLNVSFVGSRPLLEALGPAAEGVVVTQVVPLPDADLPGLVPYRAAMRRMAGTEDVISLEGFLAARLFVLALERAGPAPDRESVIDALEALGTVDLGIGVPLTLTPQIRQASRHIWPSVVRDGRFVPLDWREF
jgi:branched-chain amino acid transport system substrate-binding protein